MNKTKRLTTPGGSPALLENPPSSEVGSMDSGESRLLQSIDPFIKRSRVSRSPPTRSNNPGRRSPPGALTREKQGSVKDASFEEENKALRIKLKEMDLLYQDLKKEIDLLKEENRVLRNNYLQKECECTPRLASREYQTDEEELARETNQAPKKRPSKKRRADSSPEVESLKEQRRKEPQGKQLRTQIRAPPPINVVGVTEYKKLHSLLKGTLTSKFKVTSLRNNAWKINVDNHDDYRAVSQKLNTDKIQWYTFEIKSERPHRVVARGLHPSCTKEEVINDLQAKGFKILDAVNIIKKEKQQTEADKDVLVRRGLPLFMLTFDRSDSIEDIYRIKTIINIVVKIEPMRRNVRIIPQCKRCQGFNHTQMYCQKEPRCVKCAGNHLSQDCGVNKQSSPTCANCKGKHPANYRGCEVAKELQRRRDVLLKPQTAKSKPVTKTKRMIAQKIVGNIKPPVSERKNIKERETAEKPSTTAVKRNSIQKLPNSILRTARVQTYAQAAAFEEPKKVETSPDPVSHVFSVFLEQLEEQSKINKIILDRLVKLENNSKKTRTSNIL